MPPGRRRGVERMAASKISRLGFSLPAAGVAVFLCMPALLTGPVQAGEGSGVKSMLSLFGVQSDKEDGSADYQPRPPLVVPPRFDLPQPKEAKRNPEWPKDPDAASERRAALSSQRPAPQSSAAGNGETESKNTLPADGPSDDCQAGSGGMFCLSTPWKFLASMVSGLHSNSTPPAQEPARKYLVEPPPGYRQAVATAKPASSDAPKDQMDARAAEKGIKPQENPPGK